MTSRIWLQDYTLNEVNERGKGCMVEHLGIQITELGPDFLKGTMPVDFRTRQPRGLLHGGASVALAETLASLAANLILDPAIAYGVGLEINANHIRACTEGHVTGVSSPLHIGKTTQVWETRITQTASDTKHLVCVSRMTIAVVSLRPARG
ncbi:MAG: hypothetical protein A2X94_10705 [Bdellovibrionales bacterium GWB1_55_8]|nr:MAG: hypothetical protein A2X94_10705 [Bdellovibrionales bacterium GWB1_55_8]